jgi:predicted XRE-type DNA-binding protein
MKARTMTLPELRATRQVSQAALAVLLDVHQPAVSRLENRGLDNMSVESVRRYVAALGGVLEIAVRFGSERVMLR